MAPNFIEHVNITVGNPDRTAQMLIKLFDWRIRWRGPAAKGGQTIHVGNERFYFAVYAKQLGRDENICHPKGAPLNHIGIAVDELDEVERRVISEGLTPHSHDDYDPGRRFYFFDRDGVEYEIISYACVKSNGSFRQWLGEISKGMIGSNGFRISANKE